VLTPNFLFFNLISIIPFDQSKDSPEIKKFWSPTSISKAEKWWRN